MNFPITQATPVDIAGSTLSGVFVTAGSTIQSSLLQGINLAGNPENPYSQQDFWANQSTNGAAVLAVFDSLRGTLKATWPDLVTPEIDSAGDNLIVNPDGTVTVKP